MFYFIFHLFFHRDPEIPLGSICLRIGWVFECYTAYKRRGWKWELWFPMGSVVWCNNWMCSFPFFDASNSFQFRRNVNCVESWTAHCSNFNLCTKESLEGNNRTKISLNHWKYCRALFIAFIFRIISVIIDFWIEFDHIITFLTLPRGKCAHAKQTQIDEIIMIRCDSECS